jgi:hypothetical protein
VSGWLWLLAYVVGYLTGVRYAVNVARHAYADKNSALWDYRGQAVDAGMAGLCGAAVLFVPLFWPIVGLGILGWHLVVRPENGRDLTESDESCERKAR